MKPGSPFFRLLLFCSLAVLQLAARPGSLSTGAEVLEKSEVIVAIKTSGFEVVSRANEEWLIFKPDHFKTFKGAVPVSELRIKSFVSGEWPPGYVGFRAGKQWVVFFLTDLGGGRYQFAFDPLFQGQIGVLADVDPLKSKRVEDLLVALAESAARKPEEDLDREFLLLAGLSSEKARESLLAFSQSSDLRVAVAAVLARLKGGDASAPDAAVKLLGQSGLPPEDRRRLEALVQEHRDAARDSPL